MDKTIERAFQEVSGALQNLTAEVLTLRRFVQGRFPGCEALYNELQEEAKAEVAEGMRDAGL